MANETIKGQQIVDAAVLLLQREIVLPRLVWRMADADFRGQLDDTITLRVPAVLDARTRVMRSNTALTFDEFAETSVPVKLDTHVYQGLKIRDEELTLDIRDFAVQVLSPQIRAVAEGLEVVVADALDAATPESEVTFDGDPENAWGVIVDAGKELNLLNVPMSGRVLLLGANVWAALMKNSMFVKVNEAGTTDALRDATITKLGGLTIVTSNAINADEGWAFDKYAIALGIVAPTLPDGAAMKSRVALDGLAMRYIRDYAPENSTGPVDRSLVDCFAGAASVDDPDTSTNKRLVHIAFTGS